MHYTKPIVAVTAISFLTFNQYSHLSSGKDPTEAPRGSVAAAAAVTASSSANSAGPVVITNTITNLPHYVIGPARDVKTQG